MAANQTAKEMKELAEQEAKKALQTEKEVKEQQNKALPDKNDDEKKEEASKDK